MSYLNLDQDKTKKTVEELNILLADYHMYYQNLRNFHWNINGQNFLISMYNLKICTMKPK
jgi:starvation-inducible DNA-binding protein